jgi:hypothetical protein
VEEGVMNGMVVVGLLVLLAIGFGLFGYAFFGGMRLADRVVARSDASKARSRVAAETPAPMQDAMGDDAALLPDEEPEKDPASSN